ncbi:MAG: hypothetical protein H6613_06770 [Ignavibacteriales bacterium]|nr:hypothetical protein [Ignavibacteriales bacterium]
MDFNKKKKIVLKYLADGQSYKMIAANCNNSLETIKFHLKTFIKNYMLIPTQKQLQN